MEYTLNDLASGLKIKKPTLNRRLKQLEKVYPAIDLYCKRNNIIYLNDIGLELLLDDIKNNPYKGYRIEENSFYQETRRNLNQETVDKETGRDLSYESYINNDDSEDLEGTIAKLNKRIERYEKITKNHTEQYSELYQKNKHLKYQLERANIIHGSDEITIEEKEASIKELESEVEYHKEQYESLKLEFQSELETSNNKINSLMNDLEQARTELKYRNDEIEKLNTSSVELLRTIDELKKLLQEQEHSNNVIPDDIKTEYQTIIKDKNIDIERLREELEFKNNEILELHSTTNTLTETIHNLTELTEKSIGNNTNHLILMENEQKLRALDKTNSVKTTTNISDNDTNSSDLDYFVLEEESDNTPTSNASVTKIKEKKTIRSWFKGLFKS